MKKTLTAFLLLFSALSAQTAEELKQDVKWNLPSVLGWCTEEKAMEFIDLILEVKPEVVVDIGAFGGSSVYPAAAALRFLGKGTVFAIDPWDKLECIKYFDPIEDEEDLKWWGGVNLDFVHYSFIKSLQKFQLEDFVLVMRKTSEKAAPFIDNIDILYIDGNHSEHCSTQDVMLYLPKVRDGGYIWFNDSIWPERQEALDLLGEECEAIKLIENGNCILFRKGEFDD